MERDRGGEHVLLHAPLADLSVALQHYADCKEIRPLHASARIEPASRVPANHSSASCSAGVRRGDGCRKSTRHATQAEARAIAGPPAWDPGGLGGGRARTDARGGATRRPRDRSPLAGFPVRRVPKCSVHLNVSQKSPLKTSAVSAVWGRHRIAAAAVTWAALPWPRRPPGPQRSRAQGRATSSGRAAPRYWQAAQALRRRPAGARARAGRADALRS